MGQERQENKDLGYVKQKILLGTHTSEDEQNHVLIAEVQLPLEDSEVDQSGYDEERGEVGGYGSAPGTCANAVITRILDAHSQHKPLSMACGRLCCMFSHK